MKNKLKNNTKVTSWVLSALLLFSLASCSDNGKSIGEVSASENIDTDIPVTVSPAAIPEQAPENTTVSYTDAVGSENVIILSNSGAQLSGSGLSANENVISITKGGSYTVTGENNSIQLYIDTDSEVELILAGCSISNPDSAVIYAAKASSLKISLADNTENTLTAFSGVSAVPDEPDAVIYSKADLLFGGNGKLTIETPLGNGITGKDLLSISGGDYVINAGNNTIKGKDGVTIGGGSFDLTAGNDGIKATNTDSPTLGYVNITAGSFVIVAEGDGICAESSLIIEDGVFDIACGGGAINATNSTSGYGNYFGIAYTPSTDEISKKGLKSGSDTTINGGTFKLDCADDAIHSNGIVNYNNGTSTIASGDDGLHADTTLNINSGIINITDSYEGLEAASINITGGDISLVSSDDGINAADGSSSSAMGGRGGMSAGNALLTITGGKITVNANGDGVDSNGGITMSGGELYVFGPTDNNNGALDYDSVFDISGGTFIAFGSSGMAQSPSSSSTQPTIFIGTNGTAGDAATLTDSKGNVIVSTTSPKQYSTVIISSPALEIGSAYTVTAGTSSYEITVSSSVTSAGTTSGNMGNWGGNMNGSRPGRGW